MKIKRTQGVRPIRVAPEPASAKQVEPCAPDGFDAKAGDAQPLRGGGGGTPGPLAQIATHGVQLRLVLEQTRVLRWVDEHGVDTPCSAASGVVILRDTLFAVADDEISLGVFPLSRELGARVELFDTPLPDEHSARKAAKPDLESLALLDLDGEVHLLALGSGSTDKRSRGALIPVDDGGRAGEPIPLDLAPLYAALEKLLPDLNLEGAAVSGGVLRLAQRGNGADGSDALIDVDLAALLQAAAEGTPVGASALRAVHPMDLGALSDADGEDWPLTITDLAPIGDGRFAFTASAEATTSTYLDGEILGSAVGLLSADGEVTALHVVDQRVKLEGVDATLREDGAIDLVLVTDNDDRALGAQVFRASLRPRG